MNVKMMTAAIVVLATMIGAGCAAQTAPDQGESRDALCKLNTKDTDAFIKCLKDGIPKVPETKLPDVPKTPSTPPAPPSAPPADPAQDPDVDPTTQAPPADPGGSGNSSSSHQCVGKVGGPLTCTCTSGAKNGKSCSSDSACDAECR
jgi:hypothetical protein